MKYIVLLSVQTMKTISTTEAFARLSRNLTSAVSRSLFTLSLILTLLFSFSVNEAWGKYIYLSTANFTNWENDGATFKLYPGTGSDVDGTKVYDHMYRFDVPAVSTAANAMYFKRMSSDGGTKWNEYTVTYSASYDTYKVTGWNAGSCANTNMIEIYLDVHTNWYVDGPDFWLYPGTGSNVKGTFVGTNLLLFSVPNASGTMWFKRYQAGSTNPDSETGRWNQASVTYNSSKNTYEVTDWGAVSASYNIKIVEKGNYIYFDNSQTAWSTTYKYFVAGHDKPTAYSSTYAFTAAPITHTKLFYHNNTTTFWRDATYFAFIGNGSAFGSGEWKKSNLSAASKYTAAYENVGDLEWGKIYLFKPASGNNGAELTLNTQAVSSSLNTTQTFNYALSTDGGSTYALMSSGNTPGQLVLASYKFVDDTYNSVSANTDQTLSANSTTYTKSLSTVAYTGATTLTESSTQTGYTFVGWYEGNTQKATTASYTYYPTDDVTVTARFKAHRYSIAFDANDAQYIGTATGSTASVANVAYNTNATLTSNGFNRSGYTFAGWATTASGDIAYTDEQSVSNLSSTDGATVTLYAKWTPNTYTITLNSNGGTGSTASVEIEYGQTPPNTDALNPYFSITNPTKPGYTFLGWYTAEDGGDLVINTNGTFNADVAGYTSNYPGNIWIHPYNVTLYAKWNPVVTPIVQYTDNGGEYTTGTTGGTLTINGSSSATGVESGETYTIVATPAAGYCLESLTVGATSLYSQPKSAARQTAAYSNSSQTTTAPVTITAKFAKLKTITLYIFKGSYGGWVLQKYTPQVGNTEVTITPTATLADASHSNWVEVTFTNVTRVTGLSIAREAGAHFQDATVTQSGYYDTDKSALTGFHGKENISYGNQTYMIGDAAITLNPVYVGFATGGTYAWSVTSQPTGGAYSLSSTSVATPTFSATIAGTYTLRVTRTDADGCSASTSFNVIVTARPTTAPTAPTADECQVLSVYSRYYRSLQASFSDWGSGSTKTDRTIDHVNMWEVNVGTAWADGGFGIEWGGQTFDVSGYTGLHFDVWTPSATTLYVTPINRNAAYNGDDPESRHSGVATTAATWTSVNIPISQFAGATNRNYQLKIEGNKGQMMYLTNIYYYTTSSCPAEPVPVIHSKGIGTAQAQGEWMYRDNNGNIAGGRTNNTVDYYIATLNNEIIYKVITTDGQTMWSDAAPFLYVLNAGNGRITEFEGTRNAANTEATSEQSIPVSVDASEFDWNLCVPLVGGTHHWDGRALSEKRTYRRGYVNNPNSDVTAPTVTSAAIKAESVNDGDTTIVVTGAADNSGEYFYYFEEEETGVYHISLSNEYTIRTTTDGRILNVKCYAVDFNGNLSDAKTVRIAMPLDPSTNLALNKPAYMGRNASYVAGQIYSESNDGDLGTRWGSGEHVGAEMSNYTNEWWYVDMEGYYELSTINIWFETACSDNFLLQACETLPTPANDDTQWRTIYTNTTAPTTGNAVGNVNSYDVSGSVARYVRIKSRHNPHAGGQWGFSIWEFEVYGSAVVPKDATAPTVTTAEATAIVNGDDLQLHLVANDGSTFFRIKDNETDKLFLLEVDGTNHVVLDNKSYGYCTQYNFDIQGMDAAANLSAVTTITPTVAPPALYNLATGATATAGHVDGGNTTANAVDGNPGTRWSSNGGAAGEHWITVDLQEKYAISTVKLSWEAACPKNYYLKASTDGTHFYPIGHYTTVPATSGNGSVYETYTIPSGVEARYLQMYSVENNTGYGTSIWEFEAYGTCATDAAIPVMTFATTNTLLLSSSSASAQINVGAWDDATAFDDLRYKVVFTAGKSATLNNQAATDGVLTVPDLTLGTTYTVQIYAVDGNSNLSANYKELTFTPKVDLYYLTGDATGAAGAWEGALANETSAATRRFSTTVNDGVYHYSRTVLNNDQQYRLYCDVEGDLTYRDNTEHWSASGNQVVSGHGGETIDVYARDKDHFVSNFDDLRVYGAAVYAAEENNAFRMTYADNKFTWEGRVQSGTNAFRIIVNNNGSGVTSNSRARIMDITNWNNSSGWTHAKLTFDPATWTCTWSESVRDYCQRTGTTGDGLTINSATVLGAGESYTQEAYMSGTDWNLAVMLSGATLVNAYLQVFTAATGTGFTEYGTAFTNCGNGLFTLSVPAGDRTGWFKGNGVMRYTIKLVLEGAANVRQTDVHYYDFTGSGECAPDFFDIYHYDDVAAAPEGAQTSFDGSVIMQPIRYFRHFDNPDWTTVCVPFNVSKVTVYDTGDKRDYSLYPRFNNGTEDVEGYYWLKTFSEALPITSFESAWEQLTVNTNESEPDVLTTLVKPAKNTPYIIAFPDDGSGYYTTNWVVFHGAAGQTIDSEFTGRSSIALTDGYDFSQVQLQGNNTMHQSSTLTNIYTIDEGDDYFTRKTVAVPAFEAYLIGTAKVQASYAAVRYRGGQSVPTGVDNLPSTGDMQGSIYTATGVRVASFDGRDAMEHCLNHLSTGVYVVYTQSQVNKIVIP